MKRIRRKEMKRIRRKEMKRIFFVFGFLMAFSLVYSTTFAKTVADPGQRGPYEVGFTYFLLVDDSRDTTVKKTVRRVEKEGNRQFSRQAVLLLQGL